MAENRGSTGCSRVLSPALLHRNVLYRVNVAGVVYLNDSSWCSLFDLGANYMMFGAYCSQLVPKKFCHFAHQSP